MNLITASIVLFLFPLSSAGQGNVRGRERRILSGIWAEKSPSEQKEEEVIAGEGILLGGFERRGTTRASDKSKKSGKKSGKDGKTGQSSSSEDALADEGIPLDIRMGPSEDVEPEESIPLEIALESSTKSENSKEPDEVPVTRNLNNTRLEKGDMATNAGCSLSVDIACLQGDDGEGTVCDNLGYEEVPECEVAPHRLIFTFKGGICNKYMHPQDETRFMCQDFGQGPAMSKFETNYIEAMPPRKVGDMYFEGSVTVGDKFTVVDTEVEGNPIDEEILILVYEDDSKVNLLQMMVFHTKCKDDLVLGDVYGSLTLTAFTNEVENASLLKNVTYQVIVKNTGTSPVQIQHAINIADNNVTDLWAGMEVPMLSVGDEESILEVMELDRSHPRTVSTSVTVSGYDETMNTCAAFSQFLIELPGSVSYSK